MDGTGMFAGQETVDQGIETPINVGNDERRMHVRAYNYWVSLLGGRAYPSIEDLEPENLQDFGPNSVLLDFTGGVEDPGIAFLGEKLRRTCELSETVRAISEIPSRSLLSRLTDHYMQIIANRAPIGFEAEFTNDSGVEIMYRGILMPFSSDDDTIDFIYGVINWKEAADHALGSALADEVEHALATPPAPRREPSVPVWADGPGVQAGPSDELDLAGLADDSAGAPLLRPVSAAFAAPEPDEVVDAGPVFEPDGSESLADWLAAARGFADAARDADLRSRTALYRALSQAYDFAVMVDERPEEYAELLADCGLIAQDRAPMTPIVKLVFGIGYDKTRLAEYAAVLGHARKAGIGVGDCLGFIENYAGGLKAIVKAERAERNPSSATARTMKVIDKARNMAPRGIVELQGDDEFVVLVARRIDTEHVAVLGKVTSDERAVEKALKQLLG
jgi:hypothetical protein